MKFGYFDDANKEYVIQNPKTPYPWINYLGTQEFFSLTLTPQAAITSIKMPVFAESPVTVTTTYR